MRSEGCGFKSWHPQTSGNFCPWDAQNSPKMIFQTQFKKCLQIIYFNKHSDKKNYT